MQWRQRARILHIYFISILHDAIAYTDIARRAYNGNLYSEMNKRGRMTANRL